MLPSGPARRNHLCLLASNHNGYLREEAVAALGDDLDPVALPFLLWRTTDWVRQVRERATQVLRKWLQPEHAQVCAACLPLLPRLREIRRADVSTLIAQIEQLLLTQPGHTALRAALQSSNRITLRETCRLLDRIQPVPGADLIEIVACLHDNVARGWLPTWEERLRAVDSNTAAQLRMRLLSDPISSMRVRALWAVVAAEGPDAVPHLRRALFDRVSSVRDAARYNLRELTGQTDFASDYREAVRQGSQQLQGAIAGLGENGGPADTALLSPHLSARSRIARTALLAMVNLDREGTRPLVMAHLSNARPGLCRTALRLLDDKLKESDVELLDEVWAKAATPTSCAVVMLAIARLPPWPRLICLSRAARSSDLAKRSLAIAAIDSWTPAHRAHYAPLPPPHSMYADVVRSLNDLRRLLPAISTQRLRSLVLPLLDSKNA